MDIDDLSMRSRVLCNPGSVIMMLATIMVCVIYANSGDVLCGDTAFSGPVAYEICMEFNEDDRIDFFFWYSEPGEEDL
jgi:hypothetical protein